MKKILLALTILSNFVGFLSPLSAFAASGIYISRVSQLNGSEFIQLYNSGVDFNFGKLSVMSGAKKEISTLENGVLKSGQYILFAQNSPADVIFADNFISEKAIIRVIVDGRMVANLCADSEAKCAGLGLSKNSPEIKGDKVAVNKAEMLKMGQVPPQDEREYATYSKVEKISDATSDNASTGQETDKSVTEKESEEGAPKEEAQKVEPEVSPVLAPEENPKNTKEGENTIEPKSDDSNKAEEDDKKSDDKVETGNNLPAAKTEELAYSEVEILQIMNNSRDQFIVLGNNSAKEIDLKGCTISIFAGKNAKVQNIEFSDSIKIAANGQIKLAMADFGMKLAKTSINKIEILAGRDIVKVVEISGGKRDTAWIFDGEKWKQDVDSDGFTDEVSGDFFEPKVAPKNCGDGYFLNPATNRCKKISTPSTASNQSKSAKISTPKVCATGYTLNPATNRCKKNSTPQTKKTTVCNEGYELNEETNRCKKVAQAKEPTPCKDGYERNPETNRCRKVNKNVGATDAVENDKSGDSQSNFTGWWALLGIVILILIVVGWEFRLVILGLARKILKKSN